MFCTRKYSRASLEDETFIKRPQENVNETKKKLFLFFVESTCCWNYIYLPRKTIAFKTSTTHRLWFIQTYISFAVKVSFFFFYFQRFFIHRNYFIVVVSHNIFFFRIFDSKKSSNKCTVNQKVYILIKMRKILIAVGTVSMKNICVQLLLEIKL